MPDRDRDSAVNQETAFITDKNIINKKVEPVASPEVLIGIDTNHSLFDNIIDAGISSSLDISALNNFTQVSLNRDQIYSLIDMMCLDSTISAVILSYAEDATEYNENGHIMWAESSNSDVSKYVNYLLEAMNVDKNAYKWILSLAKYGDVYLKLVRESDFDDDILFNDLKDKKQLNEDIKIKAYSKNDHYSHYLQQIPNPAEMFELTRFDKSYAYIKADITSLGTYDNAGNLTIYSSVFKYKFKKNDIEIYEPTNFVHACLEDDSNRVPEEISLFLDDKSYESNDAAATYTVKRGLSLLYNTFKIWRELALLENAILLNRLTKSSFVRAIGVEVGDMPKENVTKLLDRIKRLFELKLSIKVGDNLSEYTNPGPIENNVYIPVKNTIGLIQIQQVGGEVDIDKLTDLDYFQDKLFGALKVPKLYFGVTDDNAGFSGGQSLSIISSRYAKSVKRLQNCLIQAITDAVNLMLLDKELDSYVNKFTIKMTTPTTQEEIDRRDNLAGKVQLTTDLMNLLNDIEDPAAKLKILKALLSEFLTNNEAIDIILKEIEKIENSEEPTSEASKSYGSGTSTRPTNIDIFNDINDIGGSEATEETSETPEETTLPNPEELDIGDLTDNNNPNL